MARFVTVTGLFGSNTYQASVNSDNVLYVVENPPVNGQPVSQVVFGNPAKEASIWVKGTVAEVSALLMG